VQYENKEGAEKAIEALNNTEHHGKQI